MCNDLENTSCSCNDCDNCNCQCGDCEQEHLPDNVIYNKPDYDEYINNLKYWD